MLQKDGGEELDDLFLLLDHGYLEDDVDFNVEIDAVVTEVSVVGVSNESASNVKKCASQKEV